MQKPCINNECMKYKLKRMFYSVHGLGFFNLIKQMYIAEKFWVYFELKLFLYNILHGVIIVSICSS